MYTFIVQTTDYVGVDSVVFRVNYDGKSVDVKYAIPVKKTASEDCKQDLRELRSPQKTGDVEWLLQQPDFFSLAAELGVSIDFAEISGNVLAQTTANLPVAR